MRTGRGEQKAKSGFTTVSARQNLKYDNENNIHATRYKLLEYSLFVEEEHRIRYNTKHVVLFCIIINMSAEYQYRKTHHLVSCPE